VDLIRLTGEPLGRQHDRTAFHCGAEALDRYLKQQARQDADKRVAAPFVAVSSPDTQVLGYYTLSASVLTLADLPDDLVRKLPRYPQLPVTLLGRLAVDRSVKGQGLGEHLLLDAVHRSLAHADQIAAMAVVVDAKDKSAASFYRHYGFLPLQAQPSRLFTPMRLVAQLLGWPEMNSSRRERA
jgi:predicted GNAT family N-acyltransferase